MELNVVRLNDLNGIGPEQQGPNMTLEKQFTLAVAEKLKTSNPKHQCRQIFLLPWKTIFGPVGREIKILSRTNNWVWQSGKGDWFISPPYGKAPPELAPGLNAIKCSGSDDVVKNLQKIKTLAAEGKPDAVLETVAIEIRCRFGK